MEIHEVLIETKKEQQDRYIARNREGGSIATDEQILAGWCYWPDIAVTFTLYDGSDEIEVEIQLDDIGYADVKIYDTGIRISNADWATLRDQQRAIGIALDAFYAQGLNKRFGRLTGE